jgi:hypothetical protein
MEQPMTGSFDLVFYPFLGPLWTVAVENADWKVPSLDKDLVGQGVYRRAGDSHEMRLDLQIDGEPPVAFDSGWVSGGDLYPFIDITLAKNGLYCYDIALHVRARPVDERPVLMVDVGRLDWSAVLNDSTFDVVHGSLTTLRASGGDFASAVDACLADDLPEPTMQEDVAVAPGEVVWFLIRRHGGSYDSGGAGQDGSRDEEIAASPLACN